jgi:hypothetical protein
MTGVAGLDLVTGCKKETEEVIYRGFLWDHLLILQCRITTIYGIKAK